MTAEDPNPLEETWTDKPSSTCRSDTRDVRTLSGWTIVSDVRSDDAYLIAAAPELYRALGLCREALFVNQFGLNRETADSAIRAADHALEKAREGD